MRHRRSVLLVLLGLFASTMAASQSVPDTTYDIVIRNARVIDPESRRDESGLNVGIRGRSIAAITRDALTGRTEIDAAGRVVAPGFIDVLSYNPDDYGAWYKLADGVTTNLAMHGAPGTKADMAAWYRLYEGKRPLVNFGGALLYGAAREKVGLGQRRAASERQIEALVGIAEQALQDGALGISMSLEYVPGISTREVEAMMRVAKRHNAPVFFHVRYSGAEPPANNHAALEEIITAARATGAAVHIDHITSTGGTFSMDDSLAMLTGARRDGLEITACAYPYPYWASPLNSERFAGQWQRRFRVSYNDLQIAGSTERLTPQTFAEYRKVRKLAVAYAIPEADVVAALRSPLVMIGSDAILEGGNNNHPRASGAFARTLAVYVRERQALTLMQALEKMTILPARRLESIAPALRRKGRLQVGADADIVIFDPERVRDRATVEHPDRYSEGIDYVLVNGTIMKDERGFRRKSRAGQAIRGEVMRRAGSPAKAQPGS